ncbi:MAG: galactosyl transferase [Alphaproteobacteria bacterium]
MRNILTFIIPVRHQDNAKNWVYLKRNLGETIASIAQQKVGGWQAIIVANNGADLPAMPPGFTVKRVDFPPNQMHELGQNNREDFYEAVRLDKGRRILAGMLAAGEAGHLMVVDDDDFISCNLTGFVASNPQAYGWYFRDGYVWSGGDMLYHYGDFSRLCGTSHIVRSDLYKLPARFEDATDAYIKRTLGSHIFLEDDLKAAGTPLVPLPFAGTIYRTGHQESHSQSNSIIKHFLWTDATKRNPLRLLRRLLRLRFRTNGIKQEFACIS